MPTAYSYRRFSSKKQERGDSLNRQTALATKYIEQHPELGLVLDTTLKDEGVSAYRGKHATEGGALGTFLEAVRDGRIERGSYLLVESLDRLSRQTPRKANRQLESIVEKGITVVTLQDGQVFNPLTFDTAEGTWQMMQSLMVMIRANEESETKGKRVKAAWANKMKAIEHGKQLTKRVPFWIDPATLEIIEARAAIVRRIFDEALSGKGHTIIAKTLNLDGVAAPDGDRWHASYIRKLLTSKNAIGVLTTGDGMEHPAYYPAVVQEATYTAVSALERSSGGVRVSDTPSKPLAGLLKCALCGNSMRSQSRSGRVKKDGTRSKWDYAVCRDAFIGKGCIFIGLPYQEVVESAYRLLRPLVEKAEGGDVGLISKTSEAMQEAIVKEVKTYEVFKAVGTERAKVEYLAAVAALDELKALRDEVAPSMMKKETLTKLLNQDSREENTWWRSLVKVIAIDAPSRTLTLKLHSLDEATGPIAAGDYPSRMPQEGP